MVELLKEAIAQKLALAEKIQKQMQPDVQKNLISTKTQGKIHLAIESFKAAGMNLTQNKFEDAIYLFSRGCSNIGETLGRSAYEKLTT